MATFDGTNEHFPNTTSIPPPDMSNEYTCFLCNGVQTVIGSIVVDSVGIILLNALGMTLEMNPYDQLVSVNEPEPYSHHALILVFPQRYVVISHLMRKSKLVETFKNVGLYKEEPTLPFAAIGFYSPDLINELHHNTNPDKQTTITHEGEELLHERVFIPMVRGGMTGSHRLMQPCSHGRDQWSNEEEQDRHIQREIRQQSLLNPIQLISSEDQARKNTVSGDWMQLEKYPSSTKTVGKVNNSQEQSVQKHSITLGHDQSIPITLHSDANGSHIIKVKRQASQVRETLLEQLKTVFPNHTEKVLQSALKQCQYEMEEAITLILSQDEESTTSTNSKF